MIDFLKQLIAEHFILIFVTVVGLFFIGLALAIKLFHELRTDPMTKEAVRTELRLLRAIVGMFRKDVLPKPGEPDPLGETALPFKAVKNPRKSGDVKEAE